MNSLKLINCKFRGGKMNSSTLFPHGNACHGNGPSIVVVNFSMENPAWEIVQNVFKSSLLYYSAWIQNTQPSKISASSKCEKRTLSINSNIIVSFQLKHFPNCSLLVLFLNVFPFWWHTITWICISLFLFRCINNSKNTLICYGIKPFLAVNDALNNFKTMRQVLHWATHLEKCAILG